MMDAYLYSGLRTPFGRHAGGLARLRPDDMLAGVIGAVVKNSGFASCCERPVHQVEFFLGFSHVRSTKHN